MTRPIPNTSADQQRSPVTLQEATAMLDQNQLLACRDAAQHMRRSGVAMPPALIALAAFPRERFQRSPEPASPAQDQMPR